MSQNVTKFERDERKNIAAQLVAENKLADEEIAIRLGVTRRQLARWKLHSEFQTKVQMIVRETALALKKLSIREKEIRLKKLERQIERMGHVMSQRAKDLKDIPGGQSGLLVRQYKQVGRTIKAQYVFDAALTKELREYLKQAAIEVGDWTEKKELSGPDGGPIPLDITSQITKIYGDDEEEESKQ